MTKDWLRGWISLDNMTTLSEVEFWRLFEASLTQCVADAADKAARESPE